MAEFVMKKMVEDAGRQQKYEVASAATSTEEIGNAVYPPAQRELARHGIRCVGKTARQLTKADYSHYDMIVAMDRRNLEGIRRIVGDDIEGKVSLLMDYTARPREVADPWYTRDFGQAWEDISEGCRALFDRLEDDE